MALVLIHGPDNAPSTTADWHKINDVFQTIGLDINSPTRISGAKILRGSVIFFAGAWYVADSDTAISGSATDYVRLTNSAGTVTAAFVSSLSGVTFNRTWNGWYDSSMRLYLFDEMKALAAGAITELATMRECRVSKNWAKALIHNLSDSWERALTHNLSDSWANVLTHNLSDSWESALSRVLSAAQLSRLFRLSSEVVLTGSGNWTVPSGVYWIEGEIIAPGSKGSDNTNQYHGASGGSSGEWRHFEFAVTPGQVIPYAITKSSTIFGSTTLLPGGWFSGQPYRGDAGGTGGGIKPGSGGSTTGRDGGDATDGYGGGGGGGGAAPPVSPYKTYGGAGGLGSVRIR